MTDDLDAARRALADPRTDPTTLAHITQAFPQLGPEAAAHPNAYPELVAWIEQYAEALTLHRVQESLRAAAPRAAGSAIGAAQPAPAASAGTVPSHPTAANAGPGRRLLLPVLAGVAALLLVTAGITTVVAVTQANQVKSAAQSAADSADRAADPASASGPHSGSAPSNSGSAATGSGSGPAATGPTGSGSAAPTEDTGKAPVVSKGDGPAPVVLILDASGSMVRETTKGRTRMDDARDAMLKAVGELPDNAQVALLVFGTGTGNSDAERAAGCTDVKTVAALGPIDRTALGNSIRGVKASGYTPIGPALRTAAKMLPEHGAGTIVLVSDGVDTCSPPPACEVASELHGANDALAIHAVGFGVDKDEQAQQQLECIGRVGGGSYLPASNVTQLGSRITAATNGTDTAKTISADGFHDVRLGMTLDEVRARSTDFKVTKRQTVDGMEIVYVDCGWGTIEFRGGLASAIRPSGEAPTLDGLAVGDKTSHAAEVYGEPVAHGKDDLGNYQVYAVSAGSPYGYAVYGDGTIKRIVLCRCTGIAASASLADWEITFAGVGPLRLGMTTKEMLAALPGSVTGSDPGNDKPATVNPLPDVKDLSVLIYRGKIASIQVGSDSSWSPLTAEQLAALGSRMPQLRGIRLGDTGATAVNIMPQGTTYDNRAGGIHDYVIATREGATLTFRGAGRGSSSSGSSGGVISGFTLTDSTTLDYPWNTPAKKAAPAAKPTPSSPAKQKKVEITADSAAQLLIPAGSCGLPNAAGWDQPASIQLSGGAGESFDADGKGAGVLDSRLVGVNDFNGDGIDDAVMVIDCTGTPKELCCAGAGAVAYAVVVLDLSTGTPQRIGEPIFGGEGRTSKGSEPLAIAEGKHPVELDSGTIVTYEVPVYGDVDPSDAAAISGWFRYALSGDRWTRSPK
ncbi:vWA domain-containing protein [Microbacterium sp. 22242]|uniref:vWA domain-containing protein n=1 Tax=Microbacterium sp. 22242 TaxID=3453896 RepID=UPI003F87344B